MTLKEWKAMQLSARVAPAYNIRNAGEGVDVKEWKNTYQLKKKMRYEEEASGCFK